MCTNVADLEEQAFEVCKLVWCDPQEANIVVGHTASEGLVRVESVCSIVDGEQQHSLDGAKRSYQWRGV